MRNTILLNIILLLFFFMPLTKVRSQDVTQKRYCTTIKAYSPIELLYKIEKKYLYNGKRKARQSAKSHKETRQILTNKLSQIFSCDSIFLIRAKNTHESKYSELIWSHEDSIQYEYHYPTKELLIIRDPILKRISLDVKSNIPLYWARISCDYCLSITIYRIYRMDRNIYQVIVDFTGYDYANDHYYPPNR